MSADRFNPRRTAGFLFEHPGSGTMAAAHSLRHSFSHRSQNALGTSGALSTPTMTNSSYSSFLERIHSAIEATRPVFGRFTPGEIHAEYKAGHDPVTEADRALDT